MKKYIIISFCLISVLGCSFSSSKQPKQTAETSGESNKTKITPYQELTLRYKQLWKQHQALRKTLLRLEEKNKQDQINFDQKFSNLTTTIQLLELNLKQQNSRIQANTKQVESLVQGSPGLKITKKQKDKSLNTKDLDESDGLSDEFITPDTSKAVKTIPFLPKTKSGDSSTKISGNKDREKERKTDNSRQGSSVFFSDSADESWTDPDLNQPVSPIKLKIIPGAKKKYEMAFKAFSNREFNKAIKLFSDFLKRYPNDRDADNCQYWLGESHFQLENYIQAEKAFRKVLRNYEHKETKLGYKTPDAMLMLGRIYVHKSMPIKGRFYFERVIERFPNSRSAVKAKREVQSMSVF